MPTTLRYPIKNQNGDSIDGSVRVEVPDKAMFDLALTPIVIVNPDKDPRIESFLLSPRTTLDVRPREHLPPHRHLPTRAEKQIERCIKKLREGPQNQEPGEVARILENLLHKGQV